MIDPKAIAVVGVGAIMPDAGSAPQFWKNIQAGLYSIRDVPSDRWPVDLYYDPDPSAPDKTYSKVGAWVRDFHFEPLKWGIPIPPRVLATMDEGQQWAIAATHEALSDFGYPQRSLDPTRVAVIFGNALSGERHYMTSMRIHLPEFEDALASVPAFKNLPAELQRALVEGMRGSIQSRIPAITEDTMPGELSNVIAGRVANVFNFAGPNFVTDAACASSLAALQAAVDGLVSHQYDAAITGGIDHNMGIEGFVKFSKIGALSPDGSRPYAEGANGFVMGEGAAVFLLKRLADAERDGDKIYAVIRGIGSSSDGKGKGITAPNPIGQQRAVERAWKNAGVSPSGVGLIEGHGTSTRVGDVVEVNSLNTVFSAFGLPAGSIALGSVKSNIGHLKSAAGAVGLLKVFYALHERILPPSVNFTRPNPEIDFLHIPFAVNTSLRSWPKPTGEIRRAGVSSFGFGGTNFHVVVEEHVPGLLTKDTKVYPGVEVEAATPAVEPARALNFGPAASTGLKPYRGMVFLGGSNTTELREQVQAILASTRAGELPPARLPEPTELAHPERLVISFNSAEELVKLSEKALKGLENDAATSWPALAAQGVFRGSGRAGKLAFLFPGQGSQYVNMLKDLTQIEPVAAETFAEADRVMTPILGRPLTSYIYVDGDEESLKKAEASLRDTAITQPAMLTANVALLRVMEKFGFRPDMVIGHSLGEYAALVAAGVLTFAEALEVVSARGREMTRVSMADNGAMAAVSAPLARVQEILDTIAGYVVIANINSPLQSVVGGETTAIDAALAAFQAAGYQATRIPVSHAFHTKIVAPASDPLRQVIARMNVQAPRIMVAANVTGELYPNTPDEIINVLGQQVASPVQFIRGIQTLYGQGARIFAEIGPKRVLNGLAADILKDKKDVTLLATNHPRKGGAASFHDALCALYAAGVGAVEPDAAVTVRPAEIRSHSAPETTAPIRPGAAVPASTAVLPAGAPVSGQALTGSVVISGAGLGLPGRGGRVFNDDNVQRILHGESFIEPLPVEKRRQMLEKRVTRLEKSEAGAQMVTIDDLDQTIKLAGQSGGFDLSAEFGVPAERVEATDISTQLAIAAGIEALRDAGIPLVMSYRPTSRGSLLPNRWMLPEALADETGVVFASAFPGVERMTEEVDRYYQHQHLTRQIEELRALSTLARPTESELSAALERRIAELQAQLDALDYHFDRRFIFRILAMGHSQFAEYVGARGPNTYVNAACATTTHAVSIAEDWIRAGRCRRVVVIAGDDVTKGNAVTWIGTGLLASGATTTEGELRMAALPFDRRRNGMIMGMGAAALVVESEDAVRERGMRGICEVLSTQIANSAFHGTRLDVSHVGQVMERVVTQAEKRFGLRRDEMATQMVFMSHETYTPARGGSAAAEIHALRATFGDLAKKVVIANTKGYTGHTMGVGVEDVVAVKALQHGIVPPIANLDQDFEPDPELGDLNLSRGGEMPVRYALRLGAGFGSQIAMALIRRIPGEGERIDHPVYRHWLASVAGYAEAEVEVVNRTLRIKHAGAPLNPPMRSNWQFGQGPSAFAAADAREPAPQPILPAVETPVTLAVSRDSVKAYVLELVSEKTGYPVEMLDLELDLEADLGVDTVKQAELFAAVREHYGIPRREDLRLVDYNTLSKVIGFVMDSKESTVKACPAPHVAQPVAETGPAPEPEPQAAAADSTTVGLESVKAYVLSLVSEKTGYHVEMLDLDLDLEADLGVDTVKQAELFAAVREHYGIPRREDLRLVDYNTLNKVIHFAMTPTTAVQPELPPQPVGQPTQQAAQQPTQQAAQQPTQQAAQQPTQQAERQPSEIEAAPAAAGVLPEKDPIKDFVLELVGEKTGYPVEMLDLDLDLEADLGVDTVKQAELFAAVREHYGIPRREDLRLAEYNTLNKVIGFVVQSTAAAAMAAPAETEPVGMATIEEPSAPPLETGVARRIPAAVLRPRPDLCNPTGIALDKATRVVVVGGREERVAAALLRRLRGRGVHVMLLPVEDAPAAAERLASWLEDGPIHGLYFLPGLEVESSPDAMDSAGWLDELQKRAFLLYRVLRALPGEPFVVAATRCGGLHGLGNRAPSAPMGGVVSGFIKALAMERPNATIKAVDFSIDTPAAEVASRLVAETLYDPTVCAVGWEGEMRFGVTLVERPWNAQPDFALDEKTVFLVSGGTGGITAPVVVDLARRTRGVFYLVGRGALPEPGDPELARLAADRTGLKQEWMRTMASSGEKPSLAEVEQRLDALERAGATLEALQAIRAAGGRAEYRAANVADSQEVARMVEAIVSAEGRVDVLVHAAGFERSRKLESKPLEEFDRTLAVKAGGFFNLYKALQAVGSLPRAVVAFSSIAGRFGNAGQTDYAAANDLLARLVASLRGVHPEMKTVVIDWGAWAKVGMASRGNIPALMKRAGIEMLEPDQAAPLVFRELTCGGNGEVVFAGSLGALIESKDPTAVLDVERANQALRAGKPAHVMLSRVTAYDPNEGVFLEAELDPGQEPFLHDHALNGTPLLPGVMGIEGFSVAAQHIASVLGSEKSGFRISRLENIQFLMPFKFYHHEPRHVTWKALPLRDEDGLAISVVLESNLALKMKQIDHMVHFSGTVHLEPNTRPIAEAMVKAPEWNGAHTVGAEDIYKLYFHGPAFQVLEGVQRSGESVLGKLRPNLPPITSTEAHLVSTPVLVELCLQTAGVWEIGATGVLSLPRSIGSMHLYRTRTNGAAIYAEVIPVQRDGEIHFNARVVDAKGHLYLELEDYRTAPLPYPVENALRSPLQALIEN